MTAPVFWAPGELSDRWMRFDGDDQTGTAKIMVMQATWADQVLVVAPDEDARRSWVRDLEEVFIEEGQGRQLWAVAVASVTSEQIELRGIHPQIVIADGLTRDQLCAMQNEAMVFTRTSGPWWWLAINIAAPPAAVPAGVLKAADAITAGGSSSPYFCSGIGMSAMWNSPWPMLDWVAGEVRRATGGGRVTIYAPKLYAAVIAAAAAASASDPEPNEVALARLVECPDLIGRCIVAAAHPDGRLEVWVYVPVPVEAT